LHFGNPSKSVHGGKKKKPERLLRLGIAIKKLIQTLDTTAAQRR
jgi:hypothetical protein